MKRRGKILRDPRFGPGLLIVEGRQCPFSLADVWKSDIEPKPGLVVEVESDDTGAIRSITAVADSQLLGEKQKAELVSASRTRARLLPTPTRFGTANLLALMLLALAWSLLTTVSVQSPFPGNVDLTFWQLLGVINAGNAPDLLNQHDAPGAGIYGGLAVVALLGPFLQQFWKDKQAAIGGLLPLFFMVVMGVLAHGPVTRWAIGGGSEGLPRARAQGMEPHFTTPVSLGFGAYMSLFMGLWLATTALTRLLASNARGMPSPKLHPKRAA